MTPEIVHKAIDVSKKLYAEYKKRYGEQAEPNPINKIRISPKNQEELLAQVALLTLSNISPEAIDVNAPFVTSRMPRTSNTSAKVVLRFLNQSLEYCQIAAMKAYDQQPYVSPTSSRSKANASTSSTVSSTLTTEPSDLSSGLSTPSNTTTSVLTLSSEETENSWKKLNFENFDVKRLQEKWFTLLMGETVEDWSSHLKEMLETLTPRAAEAIRNDVLSLALYLEKAQKVFTNTQKWLADHPSESGKRALWEKQWHDSTTGGWSALLSSTKTESKFQALLTQLETAVSQHHHKTGANSAQVVDGTVAPERARTSDKDKVIKHSSVASIVHGRQASLLTQLTSKISSKRVETTETQPDKISHSSFMQEVITPTRLFPHILVQNKEIYNERQIYSETEALKYIKIQVALQTPVHIAEKRTSSLTLSETCLNASSRLLYWANTNHRDSIELGIRFTKDTLSSLGKDSTSLDEKRAQAIGALDIATHVLIQMGANGESPSHHTRIHIQSVGSINEIHYLKQAFVALGVPTNAIQISCDDTKRITTLNESRLIENLGEHAQSILQKTKEYIDTKVREHRLDATVSESNIVSDRYPEERTLH